MEQPHWWPTPQQAPPMSAHGTRTYTGHTSASHWTGFSSLTASPNTPGQPQHWPGLDSWLKAALLAGPYCWATQLPGSAGRLPAVSWGWLVVNSCCIGQLHTNGALMAIGWGLCTFGEATGAASACTGISHTPGLTFLAMPHHWPHQSQPEQPCHWPHSH